MQPSHLVPILGDLLWVILPIPSRLRGESGTVSPGWGMQQQQKGWRCSQDPRRDAGPTQLFSVNTGKPVCSPQECILKRVAVAASTPKPR